MKTPQGSEEFIHHHKQIRDEDTECANTQYNLGVSLMEEGKLDEAIGALMMPSPTVLECSRGM